MDQKQCVNKKQQLLIMFKEKTNLNQESCLKWRRNWWKQRRLPSMPNHKLPKIVYLEMTCSVFQYNMMLQTNLTVLIWYYTLWFINLSNFGFKYHAVTCQFSEILNLQFLKLDSLWQAKWYHMIHWATDTAVRVLWPTDSSLQGKKFTHSEEFKD
jgi:hypothetical protein